ncbi:MAG: 16S rRNA (uracil(1498)-N(3))-methyltransferase [Clostridia bacterium]|nr:16S rRNA (uracil(1498)-N(3))-methyltransferase [Clostridia bacterium]
MPRFFVDRSDVGEGEILITGKDAFHIARSLRMAVGDRIEISDGCGTDYICTLSRIRDDECVATVEEKKASSAESPVEITLFMAVPKGDKLETVVQKAVELGASHIYPFESERCIKRPAADKAEKLIARLGRIAEEAAKQCGRGRLPVVHPILRFSELLSLVGGYELSLFCYEGEGTTPARGVLEASQAERISAIVGSEGGFSPKEAEALVAAGATPVGLGPRILRCETAPEYILSAISYRFEMS